jgi:UDP-glucose 6-dehydrogenase
MHILPPKDKRFARDEGTIFLASFSRFFSESAKKCHRFGWEINNLIKFFGSEKSLSGELAASQFMWGGHCPPISNCFIDFL